MKKSKIKNTTAAAFTWIKTWLIFQEKIKCKTYEMFQLDKNYQK